MAIFIPTSPSNPIVKVVVPLVAIALVYIVAKARKITASDMMLQKPPAKGALICIAAYIAFVLTTDLLFNWRGRFDFAVWRVQPFYVSACRVLAVGIFGPIAEELIFRGILFNRLQLLIKNEWVNVIVIALIWGALHLEYNWQIDALIMIDGVFLGAAMLRTRSILVPIILHIIWNLYAVW